MPLEPAASNPEEQHGLPGGDPADRVDVRPPVPSLADQPPDRARLAPDGVRIAQ